MLKQYVVTEYLNEIHEKYMLVLVDKASNNIAIICKEYCVNTFLKKLGILEAGNELY